ncbi:hypothetical protein ABN249_02575 [Providencia rettgeri]
MPKCGQVKCLGCSEGVYKQGYPFEDYISVHRNFKKAERMPYGFETFDYFSKGEVVSVKTLNTSAKTHQKQNEINRVLNSYINKVNDFKGASKSGVELKSSDIKTKTIELGVLDKTTASQWLEINQSIIYAAEKNISLRVIIVKQGG